MCADWVRPIFFYGHAQRVGEEISLHLFEPRYRLMVERFLRHGHKEFVYLFVGGGRCQVGDVGLLARVHEHQVLPDRRALIEATFVESVVVSAHWVEPGSGGLAYCCCRPPRVAPVLNMDRAEQIRAFLLFGQLRQALRTSRNHRYTVRTQRGFLNVHSDDSDPFETTNIVGQLRDGDRVVVDANTAMGPAPFFWMRVLEPVQGYCVSCTGSFEWLQPEQPSMDPSLRVTLSFSSVTAVVVGTEEQTETVLDKLQQSTGLQREELRLQPFFSRPQSVALAQVCRSLGAIVQSPLDGVDVAPERHLVGCPVSEAFAMPLPESARIIDVGPLCNARRGRSMVLQWMSEYERENFQACGEENAAIWHTISEAPDGGVRGVHPYYVVVGIGESHMFVPRDFCRVDGVAAQKLLRKVSLDLYWPKLKLLFIALRDRDCALSVLPAEMIMLIAKFIAPFAFSKLDQ